MSFAKSTTLLGVLSLAARVSAHGFVQNVVADGTEHGGYLVDKYPYQDNPPEVIGWATTAKDLGFVAPDAYSSPDIICHKDGEPGAKSASVAAGGTVKLEWNTWPESHHGPILDYLANCNGDCSSVDKTSLNFFKIAEAGLNDGSNAPGTWASDDLLENGNGWSVTIPESIAPGNYVLRHEIIALHSAGDENGAQNYPQCINLEITGGGSEKPDGVPATELYKSSDEGIKFNIYQPMDSYPIPGPPLFSGGSGGSPETPETPDTPAPEQPSSTPEPEQPEQPEEPETTPEPEPQPQPQQPDPVITTTFVTVTRPRPSATPAPNPSPKPSPKPNPDSQAPELPKDLSKGQLMALAHKIFQRLRAMFS